MHDQRTLAVACEILICICQTTEVDHTSKNRQPMRYGICECHGSTLVLLIPLAEAEELTVFKSDKQAALGVHGESRFDSLGRQAVFPERRTV